MKTTTRRLTSGETRQTGSPSGAQISQQDDSVEKEQRELTKDVSAFATPKGASDKRDETGGNDTKTDPESPADEIGITPQSAGISAGTVEGSTAVAVAEPAQGIMHKRAALALRPKMHTGLGCSSQGASPASAPIPHGCYPETAIFCHAPRPGHCPWRC